jgi:hypothetical protein
MVKCSLFYRPKANHHHHGGPPGGPQGAAIAPLPQGQVADDRRRWYVLALETFLFHTHGFTNVINTLVIVFATFINT